MPSRWWRIKEPSPLLDGEKILFSRGGLPLITSTSLPSWCEWHPGMLAFRNRLEITSRRCKMTVRIFPGVIHQETWIWYPGSEPQGETDLVTKVHFENRKYRAWDPILGRFAGTISTFWRFTLGRVFTWLSSPDGPCLVIEGRDSHRPKHWYWSPETTLEFFFPEAEQVEQLIKAAMETPQAALPPTETIERVGTPEGKEQSL